MREGRFWRYNMIGSIFWAICINTIGILFIDHYETILDNFGKISLGIIVIVIAYIFFFKRESWSEYIRAKEAEILMRESKKKS
jgi:membrane protein DedA with SNARE-associated domain